MADADPIDAVALAEGERVLWQGRPGFGSSWPELGRIVRRALFWWLVAVMPFAFAMLDRGRGQAWVEVALIALVVGVLGLPFLVSFLLAKVVGPYHLSFLSLCIAGPSFAISWSDVALSRGWQAALARQTPGDFFAAALLIGLPLVRIGAGVLRRKSLVYVVTDRRAVAVHAGATPRLLWEVPLLDGRWLQTRVRWPLGGKPVGARRRGHLLVGYGRGRRDLLMIEDPDHVLALVREALGGRITPRKRHRPLASPADPSQPESGG